MLIQLANVYIADYALARIRKMNSANIITTVAGSTSVTACCDGAPATSASLHASASIWADTVGQLFIGSYYDNTLRVVDINGIITTRTSVSLPAAVWGDSVGSVYVTDDQNCVVWKMSESTGSKVLMVGSNSCGGGVDSILATSTQLNSPAGLMIDSSGNIYIGDTNNHRVRRVDISSSIINTVIGTGSGAYDADGLIATSASIKTPLWFYMDTVGSMYFVENEVRVRAVVSGYMYTIAGSTTSGDSLVVGAATASVFSHISAVNGNSLGQLYISDSTNLKVMLLINVSPTSSPSVTPSRMPSVTPSVLPSASPSTGAPSSARNAYNMAITIVGGGTESVSGYCGTCSVLSSPTDVWLNSQGDFFFAEAQCVRAVRSSADIVVSIAGDCSTIFYSGDGGPATSAQFTFPASIFGDTAGTLFVTDVNACRVRKISNGIITLFAGIGDEGGVDAGDGGAASSATLAQPYGVWVNSVSSVYITTLGGHQVHVVNSAGIMSLIAGLVLSALP